MTRCNDKNNQKLVVLLGPTASGKSSVGLHLAKMLGGEIISGDSVCVYRGLDIGSAKPTAAERAQVPHHLVDILNPTDEYNVADFKTHAEALIADVNARGRLPLLVGGTGLYIKALLEDFQFSSVTADPAYRAELEALADAQGSAVLHDRLTKLDPAAAARLSPNDRRRLIRALETLRGGEQVSRQAAGKPVYEAAVFGLRWERGKLYERIHARVDSMLAQGLLQEVQGLLAQGVPPDALALRSLGYRQLVQYLQGEWSFAAAVDAIKQQTRHFAKRQLTWYRKMPYIEWVDMDERANPAKIAGKLAQTLAQRWN